MECKRLQMSATQSYEMQRNAMDCNGMQWNEKGIQWNAMACNGLQWNAMEYKGVHGVQRHAMECNRMQWNVLECNGM